MPREGAIIFADLIGKLDVLYVHCPKCSYGVLDARFAPTENSPRSIRPSPGACRHPPYPGALSWAAIASSHSRTYLPPQLRAALLAGPDLDGIDLDKLKETESQSTDDGPPPTRQEHNER